MTLDKRTLCVVCAWRANCAKRFSMGADSTLHCPDFTKDVTLHKAAKVENDADEKES